MQVSMDGELALYQQMIDSITDCEVIRLDDTGHVRTWHEGAARLFGYSAEEIVGRPNSVFYCADDVRDGRPAQDLRAAAETGRCSVEGWRVGKDGAQFWASVTLTPIRGHGGTLLGFVRVTRNHDDRREQEIGQTAEDRTNDAPRAEIGLRLEAKLCFAGRHGGHDRP